MLKRLALVQVEAALAEVGTADEAHRARLLAPGELRSWRLETAARREVFLTAFVKALVSQPQQ